MHRDVIGVPPSAAAMAAAATNFKFKYRDVVFKQMQNIAVPNKESKYSDFNRRVFKPLYLIAFAISGDVCIESARCNIDVARPSASRILLHTVDIHFRSAYSTSHPAFIAYCNVLSLGHVLQETMHRSEYICNVNYLPP
jgi:hypothetical protein